jgi:hypothetical protein
MSWINGTNNMLTRMRNWHSGAVSEHDLKSREADRRLYQEKIDDFTQNFDRLSALDGTSEDMASRPGKVLHVGDLLERTRRGFQVEIMQADRRTPEEVVIECERFQSDEKRNLVYYTKERYDKDNPKTLTVLEELTLDLKAETIRR